MPTANRSFTAQNYFLNLESVQCGFIKSVEGGGISAEVIQEKTGNDYFVRKHIAQVKYEDLSLQMDLSLDRTVYDWIAASWDAKYMRKDVDIFVADKDMQVGSQREFAHALITETSIPAMDAASKEPCYMTLKLAPEHLQLKKGSGKLTGKASKGPQKRWLPSNFRLDIDGLDCTRVSKVDAFTVKQIFAIDNIGEARDYSKQPGKIEFPNLKFTLAEKYAGSWMDWHADFVIKGNNGDGQEKNGSLTFLSPNLTTELARINFFNLGIFRLAPEEAQSQSNQIQRIVAEMYCERMEFLFPGK